MKTSRSMVAVLVLSTILMVGTAPAPRKPDCSTLRIMTYNIRLDTPADGDNRWDRRRALLLSQIDLVRPQVLGMQEVLLNQRRDVEAGLPGYVRLGGGRDDGADKGEASPLFVERRGFSVLTHGQFWLSPTPDTASKGWDAAYLRIATWAHLRRRTDGWRVLAINSHWDNEGRQARRESALMIARWIGNHRSPGEAVVVLGDFNAPASDDAVSSLVSEAGLDDAAAAATSGPVATFNGFQVLPGAGAPIDHVLFDSRLAATAYHVLAEHFGGRLASDHFPVIADLVPKSDKEVCGTRRE